MYFQLRIDPNLDDETKSMLYKYYSNVSPVTGRFPNAGFDLIMPKSVLINGNETSWLDLGISCAAYKDESKNQPVSYYLYSRSSISKTPLRLANCVGIIDSGYRGNIIAAVDNTSSNGFTADQGKRLFQICAPNLESITFELVDKDLEITERGSGSFGSTGK